ncbi:MAG TPA: ribosome maturation factor RimM [Candidatus Ozemobacteraceae bacterium]|nr:ribosome maturation factor RimM [Candidatus Ozemobacteraceae bacterium]
MAKILVSAACPAAGSPSGDPAGQVVIARLSKAVGLQGWVRITMNTDNPERFMPGTVLNLRRQGQPVTPLKVVDWRETSSPEMIDLMFEGIEDMDTARNLMPGEIVIDRNDRVPPPPGAFYPDELEGMKVVGPQGDEEGVVERLVTEVPSPYLSVRSPKFGEVFVPYRLANFIAIDRGTRTVRLNEPLERHIPVDC